jgi:hypothetical protein
MSLKISAAPPTIEECYNVVMNRVKLFIAGVVLLLGVVAGPARANAAPTVAPMPQGSPQSSTPADESTPMPAAKGATQAKDQSNSQAASDLDKIGGGDVKVENGAAVNSPVATANDSWLLWALAALIAVLLLAIGAVTLWLFRARRRRHMPKAQYASRAEDLPVPPDQPQTPAATP